MDQTCSPPTVDDEKLMGPCSSDGLLKNSPSDEDDFLQTDHPAVAVAADHQQLDALEVAMLDSGLPVVELPLEHAFFPGLYRRTITMPAGTLLTSKIHNTEHPYVVLSGRVRVALPGEPAVELTAGHQGTTRPGTRRLLYIVEDCRWSTFHPLSPDEEAARERGAGVEELLAMIEARIIKPHRHADGTDAHAEYLAGLRALAALPGLDETEGIP